MKASKLILMAIAMLVIFARLDHTANAFHDGGVGPCEACHTMHNSQGGLPVEKGSGYGNVNLLIGSDQSSTCLICHAGNDQQPTTYHVMTFPALNTPVELTPGGDFAWLQKNYSWVSSATGTAQYSYGQQHGHNITAQDYGYVASTRYATAPGGSYPALNLACTSCHDPHGQYRRNADGTITTTGSPIKSSGSFTSSPAPDSHTSAGVYRLLGGKNYQPQSLIGNFAFVNDPPATVAPINANRSEAITQTRVAYGSGMSEWCQNCHPEMHTAIYPGSTNLLHNVGSTAKLGAVKSNAYNTYISTGNVSGTQATAFLSLVPFEEGISDYSVLQSHAKTDDTYLAGPDASTAQVMCLSCHRAHASGWNGSTRWNTETALIISNGHYAQEGQAYQPYGQGRTELDALTAYYGFPESRFTTNQDTLCNKCHGGVYP